MKQKQTQIKSPLKWCGGKAWIADHLRGHWKPHQRVVMPFCGGCSDVLSLMPSRALLNDLNEHLINFWIHVQKGMIVELDLINSRDAFNGYRQFFNSLIKTDPHSQLAAELFLYLNKQGFRGLCRFNGKGEFNVPFGDYKKLNFRTDFTEFVEIMKNWKFSSVDFSELEIESDDFVYCDPPYDVEFTKYTSKDFTWNEQIRLAEWAAQLDASSVILSNQSTKRIIKLYTDCGFEIILLSAPRKISIDGDRSNQEEVFAVKKKEK